MSTDTIECCICFEAIGEKNNCVTPCGHKFCFVCLTKALTNNNTCPCCREVLIEVEEEVEEDDESEYEPEDDESDGGSEEDDDELRVSDMDELSLEDLNDNAELIYERMIKKGITTKEIMQMLFSDYYGTFRDGLNDIGEQIERKMSDILNKEIIELIKETKIKKEQMMFLREDKERNINALDMIALNYA
jgi:Ring finger domain